MMSVDSVFVAREIAKAIDDASVCLARALVFCEDLPSEGTPHDIEEFSQMVSTLLASHVMMRMCANDLVKSYESA